jgi:large conductance mechanosensitive channel
MGILQEFKDFLNEYKVIGLAVAFIMGVAATNLVQSLVNDIIMPCITPFIPNGQWQTATIAIGPIVMKWGSFLGQLINFVILAFVVFMVAKYALGEQKVTKK